MRVSSISIGVDAKRPSAATKVDTRWKDSLAFSSSSVAAVQFARTAVQRRSRNERRRVLGIRIESGKLGRDVRQTRLGQPEVQVIKKSAAPVRANNRLTLPIGFQQVVQVRVECWTGARTVLLITGVPPVASQLELRDPPVPVQNGDIVV